MNEKLLRLRALALRDDSLRNRIVLTEREADPLSALCAVAASAGIDMEPEEIIACGEELSCNQMKSTNGGNPHPYKSFDDAYEWFILSLRR